MHDTVIAALISATAAAGIAVGQSGWFGRFLAHRATLELRGTWISRWNEGGQDRSETIEITKMRGNRVYGTVTSEETPYACRVEGQYAGRFLQLTWQPEKTQEGLIDDFGCYFLERLPDGTLSGYAVGFYYHLRAIAVFQHAVKRP
jgi:hypothetical protein